MIEASMSSAYETDSSQLYPYLGINKKRQCVLFTSLGKGHVVCDGVDNIFGEEKLFDESQFKVFYGSITLTQRRL